MAEWAGFFFGLAVAQFFIQVCVCLSRCSWMRSAARRCAKSDIHTQTGMSWFLAISGETIVTRVRADLFRAILRQVHTPSFLTSPSWFYGMATNHGTIWQETAYFDDPENSSGALLSMLGSDCVFIQLVTGQQVSLRQCCP